MKPLKSEENQYIILGKLGAVYGIHGWLKINSFTDPVTNIFDYKIWYIKTSQEWQPLNIDKIDIKADKLLAHVVGYDTPEHAKQLTGLDISVHRSQLPSLPADEYYWHDLVGLSVYTLNNDYLGLVVRVINAPAHPLLEIKDQKEHLVPLIFKQFIKTVDLNNQTMIIDWDPEF
jgi:16S rRNA processing protein RimM